jgi:hypothetical protein
MGLKAEIPEPPERITGWVETAGPPYTNITLIT